MVRQDLFMRHVLRVGNVAAHHLCSTWKAPYACRGPVSALKPAASSLVYCDSLISARCTVCSPLVSACTCVAGCCFAGVYG